MSGAYQDEQCSRGTGNLSTVYAKDVEIAKLWKGNNKSKGSLLTNEYVATPERRSKLIHGCHADGV